MKGNKIRVRAAAFFGAALLAAGGLVFADELPQESGTDEYIEVYDGADFLETAARLTYYKEDNLERYQELALAREDLTAEEIVVMVNASLDYPFYEMIKPVESAQSILVLCNKYNKLDSGYVPDDLVNVSKAKAMRREAAEWYLKMAEDMKLAGVSVTVRSAYRSYSVQSDLYNGYVRSDGRASADTYSARPGHSEHQTGLAVDIVQSGHKGGTLSGARFEKTAQYQWLLDNAHLYGFILRYPEGRDDITGYKYEPWHWRYIGVEHATAMRDNGIETFEEYHAMFADIIFAIE